MKTSFSIRKAKASDMSAVLNLIQELATFEKEPEAVIVTEEDLIKHGFGKVSLFTCFVAEVDNQIVGMALGYPRYSTWKGPTLHLEDLIVTDSFKGKGIGKALFSTFIRFGYKQGVKRIEWAVLDWNTSAIDFYIRQGASILNDWRVAQMDPKAMHQFISKTQ
jgi:GNAT superfamily N-acetyltransferase